jgi:hypothetical protein
MLYDKLVSIREAMLSLLAMSSGEGIYDEKAE